MSSNLTQTLMSQSDYEVIELGKVASQFTPAEIRQTIADLVIGDQLALAGALTDAGLSLYPESEDILAISALVAEVNSDWTLAEEMLKKLIEVQGDLATPFTLRHLVRVQRCLCEIGRALFTANKALELYPENSDLLKEQQELSEAIGDQLMAEMPDIAQ